jgi:hypothetical protein
MAFEFAAEVYILAPPLGIIGQVSGTVQPAIKTFVPSNVNSRVRSPSKAVFIIRVDDSPKNPIKRRCEYLSSNLACLLFKSVFAPAAS